LSVAPQSLDDQAALQELAPAAFHAVKYGTSGAMPLQSTLNDTQLWRGLLLWSLHRRGSRGRRTLCRTVRSLSRRRQARRQSGRRHFDLQVDFGGQHKP
jgi:hypothetical protein